MSVHRVPVDGRVEPSRRRQLVERVLRYAAGSVVATICSEATFLLLYGPLGASPAASSAVAWLAGAIPNYWLNRTWTWKRRGKPNLVGELLPYVAIVLGTLLLAVAATTLVDHRLNGANVTESVRVALVGGTFLGVYGMVFLLRFFLLEWLFRRAGASSSSDQADAMSTEEIL
jgi:putative flippase GtrA